MKTPHILTAVYGTLRVDQGNFNAFSRRHSIEVVKQDIVVHGWKLYTLGGYPGAIYTGNLKDTMICDLIKTTKECASEIDYMELGANYCCSSISTGIEEGAVLGAKIYEYIGSIPEEQYIEDGDWIKHITKIRAERAAQLKLKNESTNL